MSIRYGIDRDERMLLPECVEDYVRASNPVRVVDAFVESLDLVEVGIAAGREDGRGAPEYDAKALLKLYLYGYLNRVRSSRELEKAARRNLEVIWLMRKLTPDHWTINAFRQKHAGAFKAVFRQFHVVCGQLGLFGAELVAIDSAFFKGCNNPAHNQTRQKVLDSLERIDTAIAEYLKRLEASDAEAPRQATEEFTDLAQRLEGLGEKRAKAQELLQAVEQSPTGQLSSHDSDSRSLKKGGQAVVGYHVQMAVDAKHHLIVANETLKKGDDKGQLLNMAQQAKEALAVQRLDVVADGGYYNVDQINACGQEEITAYVPEPKEKQAGDGTYSLCAFRHDAQKDVLVCPQGHELLRHQDTWLRENQYKVYYHTAACRNCPVLKQCTSGTYRKVKVPMEKAVVEALRQRIKHRPDIFKQRSAVAEHPFGTMKFWMGAFAVLTRGWQKVSGEINLTCLAYNLKRVLNLLGTEALLDYFRSARQPA